MWQEETKKPQKARQGLFGKDLAEASHSGLQVVTSPAPSAAPKPSQHSSQEGPCKKQKALSSQWVGETLGHNTATEEEPCQKPSSVVELIVYFQLVCQKHLAWLSAQLTAIPPMNWKGSGARSFVFPSRVLVAVTGPDRC